MLGSSRRGWTYMRNSCRLYARKYGSRGGVLVHYSLCVARFLLMETSAISAEGKPPATADKRSGRTCPSESKQRHLPQIETDASETLWRGYSQPSSATFFVRPHPTLCTLQASKWLTIWQWTICSGCLVVMDFRMLQICSPKQLKVIPHDLL